MQANW